VLFASLGLIWGPTGSAGFELATGVPAAGAASDLDVVVRAPEFWPLERAREVAEDLAPLPARVDAQLDTPAGAVTLAEYACGGHVLVRTPDGPRLTRDPWREASNELRIT
jgi:phosphoribosyl-dephospho-CoA transferase